MNRRSFLASILAAGVAPAFVRGGMGILMPVRELVVPELVRARHLDGNYITIEGSHDGLTWSRLVQTIYSASPTLDTLRSRHAGAIRA